MLGNTSSYQKDSPISQNNIILLTFLLENIQHLVSCISKPKPHLSVLFLILAEFGIC